MLVKLAKVRRERSLPEAMDMAQECRSQVRHHRQQRACRKINAEVRSKEVSGLLLKSSCSGVASCRRKRWSPNDRIGVNLRRIDHRPTTSGHPMNGHQQTGPVGPVGANFRKSPLLDDKICAAKPGLPVEIEGRVTLRS